MQAQGKAQRFCVLYESQSSFYVRNKMQDTIKVILPWPSKELSPNARVHWAKLAKAKKAYRQECYLKARIHGVRPIQADALHLDITFFPKTARAYDLDNALASIKAGLDGIADALRVDDSLWTLTIRKGEPGRGVVAVRVLTVQGDPQYVGGAGENEASKLE